MFGDFTKGELIVHTNPKFSFNKRNTFLFFDGHIPHESKPFGGAERYSIVVFYHSTCNLLSDKNRQFLEDIGFRLPGVVDQYPIAGLLRWSLSHDEDFLPTIAPVDYSSESDPGSDGSTLNTTLYRKIKLPTYNRVLVLLTDKKNHALTRITSFSRGCATYVFPTCSIMLLDIRSLTRFLRRPNVLFVVDLFNCTTTTDTAETLASVTDGYVSSVEFHRLPRDRLVVLDNEIDRQECSDIHVRLAQQLS